MLTLALTHTHAHMHILALKHIHIHIHKHSHTHKHAYIYTHKKTYTYTNTQKTAYLTIVPLSRGLPSSPHQEIGPPLRGRVISPLWEGIITELFCTKKRKEEAGGGSYR